MLRNVCGFLIFFTQNEKKQKKILHFMPFYCHLKSDFYNKCKPPHFDKNMLIYYNCKGLKQKIGIKNTLIYIIIIKPNLEETMYKIIRRRKSLARRIFKSKLFAVLGLITAVAVILVITTIDIKAIWIIDGNERSYVVTASRDVDEILSAKGVVTSEQDKIHFSGFDSKNAEIVIKRAYPVSVVCDGVDYAIMCNSETVAEVLNSLDIILGEEDKTSHPLDYVVAENDKIVVNRIETKNYTVTEVVKCEMEEQLTPLLRVGKTRVLKEGVDGEVLKTYREVFVDGVSMGVEVVSEEVLSEVANGVVLVGDDVPASPLKPETEIEFDKNGNPVNYKKVFKNQVATAYSAKPGSKGASGLPAKIGYVAVRASMIPYGSELYIKTPDGSFVYGYCIAGDTGVGLLQNVIDVDVFFDTYLESCLFGRKTVDIYVLN